MGANSILTKGKAIVFFDTNCLLCSRLVNILLKNDRQQLHYSGFNSHAAFELLPTKLREQPETLVFAENGILYSKSMAVFKIITFLNWPWQALKLFNFLPTSFNDRIYDWVAKNRLRWFGRSQKCYLPKENVKNRFFA